MRRMLLIGALAWMPAPAMAQHVYKCVAAGQVSYQSTPCQDGRAPARTWEHGRYAPPVSGSAPAAVDAKGQSRARPAAARRRDYAEGRLARAERPDRCQSARRKRESRLQAERLGHRSMELRRSLDRMVAEACGQ